jgi:hypothetical protein
MADYPALDVKSPDVMGTLNDVLGLQSKKLALQKQAQDLQTGQALQQTAQADASQAQQKNTELSGVADLVKNADRFRTPDGGFDDKAFSDEVARRAPVYGQQIRTQALSAAGESLTNRTTAQNLTDTQRTSIAGTMKALAGKPDLSMTDIINASDQLIDQNPDPQFRRMVLSTVAHLPQTASPQQLQQVVSTMAGTMSGQSPIEMAPNAAGQTVVRDKNTGQIRAPTYATGSDSSLNPSSTKVAAATGAATGAVDIDTKRAAQVSDAAQSAPGQIALTKQADRLVDMIQSGTFSAFTDNMRKEAGSDDPSVVARFELKKVLGTLKDAATAHAGSDARLATQLEQFPDETSPNEVVHSRMDTMRGTYRLFQERRDNLNSYQSKYGLAGFQLADDHLSGGRDPLTAELHALPPGSNERRQFLTRTYKGDRDAMQDAIERERASYHTVGNAK